MAERPDKVAAASRKGDDLPGRKQSKSRTDGRDGQLSPRLSAARARSERSPSPVTLSQSSILLRFLDPDVVPIVLGYTSVIAFDWVQTWGREGMGDGEFIAPRALALRGRDEIFVCDVAMEGRIQVFHHSTGRFLRKWGTRNASEPGSHLLSFAFHVEDDITIVLDRPRTSAERPFYSNRLQVFSSCDAKYLYPLNLPTACGLPRGILVDSNQTYYIPSDQGDINVYSASPASTSLIYQGCLPIREEGRANPRQMIVQDHQLFAVDWQLDCVHLFDLDSKTKIGTFGGSGSNTKLGTIGVCEVSGKLVCPTGVAVHGDQVIVASTAQGRLVIFDRKSCQFTRECHGSLGRLTTRQFQRPTGLLINPFTNQLLVCDEGNHCIVVLE